MRPTRGNLGGRSNFPPNPKQWAPERNGLALRARVGRRPDAPLEPFEVARALDGVDLVDRAAFEQVVGAPCAGELFGRSRDRWSGFVVPVDGRHLIVINGTHAVTRQHATLTEELFHIILNHQPSRLFRCPVTGLLQREYTPDVEHDAYWSAAAALLPYAPLRDLLRSGGTIESIAEAFGVSVALVEFRMKVTKLWRRGR